MSSSLQRPRGKRLLALAAVVIGGVLLAQRYILSERVEERELAARAESPEQAKRVEHTALESKPSPSTPPAASIPPAASVTPAPNVPSSIVPAKSTDSLGENGIGASAVSPEEPTRTPATSSSTPLPSKPAASAQPPLPLAPPKSLPRRVERPAPRVPPSAPLTLGSVEPSWGGAASEPTTKEDDAERAAPAPGSPSAAGAAAPNAKAQPVAGDPPKPSGAPGVLSGEPRPFAGEQAQQQLVTAASEASRCASMGSTRGSGKVNVSIATWGRVVRVTHLNQAFVGTPVGVCVMEAFQKVHVPPFDGATQTLAGSFLIQ
jgi:hypothetical protein